ncbi:hypothetical protein BC829DRAFT_416573 [Chytridium lagenaria]|nr:hypothetical protein BC829DRAFT_416573 [Chytridium lagenaria]
MPWYSSHLETFSRMNYHEVLPILWSMEPAEKGYLKVLETIMALLDGDIKIDGISDEHVFDIIIPGLLAYPFTFLPKAHQEKSIRAFIAVATGMNMDPESVARQIHAQFSKNKIMAHPNVPESWKLAFLKVAAESKTAYLNKGDMEVIKKFFDISSCELTEEEKDILNFSLLISHPDSDPSVDGNQALLKRSDFIPFAKKVSPDGKILAAMSLKPDEEDSSINDFKNVFEFSMCSEFTMAPAGPPDANPWDGVSADLLCHIEERQSSKMSDVCSANIMQSCLSAFFKTALRRRCNGAIRKVLNEGIYNSRITEGDLYDAVTGAELDIVMVLFEYQFWAYPVVQEACHRLFLDGENWGVQEPTDASVIDYIQEFTPTLRTHLLRAVELEDMSLIEKFWIIGGGEWLDMLL